MRFLVSSLPAALTAVVALLIGNARTQTPLGFHCDTDAHLQLRHADGWRFRTGARYRASDMAESPGLSFDDAQLNQTYTTVIIDLPILGVSNGSSSVFQTSDRAYLCSVHTSLRVDGDTEVLTSSQTPIVPFSNVNTNSTEPHLIVALLFGTPSNSTLPKKLQQQLWETGQCEESRADFDFVNFLTEAELRSPVAANWFTVAWNDKQGNAEYVTTTIPTLTRTVTASASSTSTSIFPANIASSTTTGNDSKAPLALALCTVGAMTAADSSLEDPATSATLDFEELPTATLSPSLRANTSSLSSAQDSLETLGSSGLTTLTLNPTATLGAGSGDGVGTGGLTPVSTGGLIVTAGSARDQPALVGAAAALMATAGFYWMFL